MRPVLITAGATRNPLDAIRCLSAFSSGRTGVALASALHAQHSVTLLGSAEALLRAQGLPIEGVEYRSTRDLMAKMKDWVLAHPAGVVLHAAAVGDYEAAAGAAATKLPSGSAELVLRLQPTPKIVDAIRGWSPRIRLVSFKAASPETTEPALVALAQAQQLRTGSHLVFANVIGRLGELVLLVRDGRVERFDDRSQALDALVAAVAEL